MRFDEVLQQWNLDGLNCAADAELLDCMRWLASICSMYIPVGILFIVDLAVHIVILTVNQLR